MEKYQITLYYANWCGACHVFIPIWEEFKEEIKRMKQLKNKNGDKIKLIVREYEESKDRPKFDAANIQSYPTIKIIKDGKTTEFNSERTIENLMKSLDIMYEPTPISYYPKPELNKPIRQNTQTGGIGTIYAPATPSIYYPNRPYMKSEKYGGDVPDENSKYWYAKYKKYRLKYDRLQKQINLL